MKGGWSVSGQVLAIFHGRTSGERERVLKLLEMIAQFPAEHKAFEQRGADGRLYSIAELGSWIITFWIDPDAETIRFVELQPN